MRIVKNLEKTKIQSKETKGYLDETKDSLAEELLESLLQHVGDSQVIESILTMCIDMLGSNNSQYLTVFS